MKCEEIYKTKFFKTITKNKMKLFKLNLKLLVNRRSNEFLKFL